MFWGRGGGAGAGAVPDHVGGEIFCRRGSLEESFDQLPWQNIGTMGTEGTIAEDLVKDAPEAWGWSLIDRVLVGDPKFKCLATSEGQPWGV